MKKILYSHRTSRPPYLRSSETTHVPMRDMMFAFLFLLGMSFYYYGARVFLQVIVSCLVAEIADLLLCWIGRKKVDVLDFSPLVTGTILAMLLPVNINVGILVLANLFAIAVAKHSFGGLGNNIFNPAAAGLALITVAFADRIFLYPQPLHHLGFFESSVLNSTSLTYTLKFGGIPATTFEELIIGGFSGPMGATNIIVILACLLFLGARKTISIQIPIVFLFTAGIFAFLFPRVEGTRIDSVLYELCSGYLLFAAVFMITDPVTAPKHKLAKYLYGALGGALTMLMRYIGGYEQVACFAILLCNAFSYSLDCLALNIKERKWREK